jgi:hypothetical protein
VNLKRTLRIELTYRGLPNRKLDKEICSLARRYRGKSEGSGYFFPRDIRDLSFEFSDFYDAKGFALEAKIAAKAYKPNILRCPKCAKVARGFVARGKRTLFIHSGKFAHRYEEKSTLKGCLVSRRVPG